MNKYPIDADMQKLADEGHDFRFASTNGLVYHTCPQCGASPRFHCETPKGRRAETHGFRSQLGFTPNCTIKVQSFSEIMKSLNGSDEEPEGTQSDGTS